MKRTESESVSDEGFTFETTSSNVEETTGERLRNFYEEFIYKPGLVAWDDMRTRIGLAILAVYVLTATVGVWLYEAPTTNQDPRSLKPLATPSSTEFSAGVTWTGPWDAPLGTTQLGTDIAAQLIHATPNMLVMVTAGGIFATGIALIVGTVAGYKGGRVDKIVTTFSDVMMSIPGLPLVMVVAVIYSPENPAIVGILVTINYWAGLGRSIRSQVLTLREESYVEASRTMGISWPRILFKDVIPNLMPFVLVNFANAARYVVFASVGLYYLGVLDPGLANWGLQLDKAYNEYSALVTGELYLIIPPMIAIGFLALSFVLLAQGLDRVFNPRVRTRLAGESESEDVEGEDSVAGVGI